LPFISYGPLNSLLFGVYGVSLNLLEKDGRNREEASLQNVFCAGLLAGIVTTIPTNPFELVKLQLQTHSKYRKLTLLKDSN
jgi:hypothetical protein